MATETWLGKPHLKKVSGLWQCYPVQRCTGGWTIHGNRIGFGDTPEDAFAHYIHQGRAVSEWSWVDGAWRVVYRSDGAPPLRAS